MNKLKQFIFLSILTTFSTQSSAIILVAGGGGSGASPAAGSTFIGKVESIQYVDTVDNLPAGWPAVTMKVVDNKHGGYVVAMFTNYKLTTIPTQSWLEKYNVDNLAEGQALIGSAKKGAKVKLTFSAESAEVIASVDVTKSLTQNDSFFNK